MNLKSLFACAMTLIAAASQAHVTLPPGGATAERREPAQSVMGNIAFRVREP